MGSWINGWKKGRVDGWMGGLMDGCEDGWMDMCRWMDGCVG